MPGELHPIDCPCCRCSPPESSPRYPIFIEWAALMLICLAGAAALSFVIYRGLSALADPRAGTTQISEKIDA